MCRCALRHPALLHSNYACAGGGCALTGGAWITPLNHSPLIPEVTHTPAARAHKALPRAAMLQRPSREQRPGFRENTLLKQRGKRHVMLLVKRMRCCHIWPRKTSDKIQGNGFSWAQRARAKIMLVRARQRGLGKLPRTGSGACLNVPCIQCSATRPLACDSRPLVSRMFLHTHCSSDLRARASARRAEETLGEGNLEQSVLPTVRKRSQTSSRPSQVLARWGTNAPFVHRTHVLTLPQRVFISADPVHLYSHPREEKLPPAAHASCIISCRCERLSRLADSCRRLAGRGWVGWGGNHRKVRENTSGRCTAKCGFIIQNAALNLSCSVLQVSACVV